MKLRFKHQKFQEDATNAVCDVFTGQPNETRKFLVDQGSDAAVKLPFDIVNNGWGNSEIRLRPEDILKNLRTVQKQKVLLLTTSSKL